MIRRVTPPPARLTQEPPISSRHRGSRRQNALGCVFAALGISGAVPAGVASAFSITAANSDGSTDQTYTGTLHFTSSDAQAVLPADCTLTKGSATLGFTLKTPGAQSIIATDRILSGLTGSLSIGSRTGMGQTVFCKCRSRRRTPGLGWTTSEARTTGTYVYDGFTLPSPQTLTEIDWRGGYSEEARRVGATNFTVTIFDSISRWFTTHGHQSPVAGNLSGEIRGRRRRR